ncbi:hypothetical protein [Thermus thermophilus]|uniref:Uncharacterized protein n=1 Tax=Thermus thermophilus (strain ATCC BAA-163 / DSM 7039 / HB27) TaxID=262724 RepID=Q72L51_THET2|nr:hypothetical protein [Thermus thermophilus]AAS80560.1 hypothetical protein TT_C0212 [Thermus thermophilus HB27]QMV30271.1 hypothetical protein HB27c_C0225 [Thermus thermophilus]WMV95616.1 hypothetical protein RB649_01080 [Thermus thermophilus HB27]
MRYALRFRPLAGGEYLLPLPQTLPGQEVGEVFLSHKPLEVYEAQGNLLARFALEEGEALEARFRLRTTPLQAKPSWREALLREPPEAWPGILAHRGHRVERALGFLLSGKPHAWYLVDGLPLDPLLFQALRENPALLLPLGVAPDPRSYLGGHEGKRLLLLKTPWPGEEDPLWGELRSLGLDPLPPARALAFLSLGASALGLSTGPWPYLPYLALLALRQGPALKDLLRQSPRHALESLLFHAFALSVTTEVRPELGLAYLGLLFWNRTRPPWREGPHLG